MRLTLAPLERLLPDGLKVHSRDRLLFQRLSWGALAGCLATLLLAESPILESMELSMLEWHYRSQDERLIAFSNASFYDGRLVTFPGPAGATSIQHVLVSATAVGDPSAPSQMIGT